MFVNKCFSLVILSPRREDLFWKYDAFSDRQALLLADEGGRPRKGLQHLRTTRLPEVRRLSPLMTKNSAAVCCTAWNVVL